MDDADRDIRLAVCLSSFQRLSGNGVDWTDEEGVTLMRIVLSESRPHSFCKKKHDLRRIVSDARGPRRSVGVDNKCVIGIIGDNVMFA